MLRACVERRSAEAGGATTAPVAAVVARCFARLAACDRRRLARPSVAGAPTAASRGPEWVRSRRVLVVLAAVLLCRVVRGAVCRSCAAAMPWKVPTVRCRQVTRRARCRPECSSYRGLDAGRLRCCGARRRQAGVAACVADLWVVCGRCWSGRVLSTRGAASAAPPVPAVAWLHVSAALRRARRQARQARGCGRCGRLSERRRGSSCRRRLGGPEHGRDRGV